MMMMMMLIPLCFCLFHRPFHICFPSRDMQHQSQRTQRGRILAIAAMIVWGKSGLGFEAPQTSFKNKSKKQEEKKHQSVWVNSDKPSSLSYNVNWPVWLQVLGLNTIINGWLDRMCLFKPGSIWALIFLLYKTPKHYKQQQLKHSNYFTFILMTR